MLAPPRLRPSLRYLMASASLPSRGLTTASSSLDRWRQHTPRGEYYASIMRDPVQYSPKPATAQERARIVFGSRLSGPVEQADRLQAKQAKSTVVAGVLVPPKPEEPDNCCMSGCVNCVWERYREDVEEWTARKKEAQERQARPEDAASEGAWAEERVYADIPVGIREFMKQEKKLKEKHAREGSMDGS